MAGRRAVDRSESRPGSSRTRGLSDPGAAPRAAVATELGMTEGNLRVAIHRLRARVAAGFREEVAATIQDAGDEAIEEELRTLFAIPRT